MSLPVQRTLFGNSLPIGDTEQRILASYRDNPKVADSDRLLILSVWESEGLTEVLGDKLAAFKDWFTESATSTETIARAGRKLRAAGVIRASPEVTRARRELAEQHRNYWRER